MEGCLTNRCRRRLTASPERPRCVEDKMREFIIRTTLLAIGMVTIICGTVLLKPWFETTATYVHPAKAFYGAILFIGFGGFFLALGSIGFRGFANTKSGRRLLCGKADDDKITQQTAN